MTCTRDNPSHVHSATSLPKPFCPKLTTSCSGYHHRICGSRHSSAPASPSASSSSLSSVVTSFLRAPSCGSGGGGGGTSKFIRFLILLCMSRMPSNATILEVVADPFCDLLDFDCIWFCFCVGLALSWDPVPTLNRWESSLDQWCRRPLEHLWQHPARRRGVAPSSHPGCRR